MPNDPLLTAAHDLLLEVMHNPNVPLRTRVDIAIQLVNAGYQADVREHYPGEHRITIVIHGLGNNPPELIEPEAKVQVH